MNILLRLKNVMQGKEGTLRERTFCTINLIGGVMAIVALLETLPMANPWVVFLSLGLLVLALIIGLVLVLKYHYMDAASVIVGMVLCGIVLPDMYFSSGGIEGGATVWLSINIVYTFLMFEGKSRIFFIVMDIFADLICYGIGYHYPEMVSALPSRQAIFLDSLFSVIMVGMAVGLMLQVYIHAYAQQQKKIEEQKQELEKAGDAKNHFFASMSHEIRTPINSIIGLNEMIIRENPEGVTREYAENVQGASKMLLSLVNDILDVSQMEMKKMEIVNHPYDVAEMFKNVIELVRVQMEEKHLELQVDIDERIPKMLIGDRKRVQQILINLMTNAVKYTPSGSVTLSARIEESNDEGLTLRLMVRDTGIGIRKENLANLYDTFKRVDDVRTDNIQGSGLGLNITKQLVDLMDGEILVDSIYSKGSVFTVLLPQKVEEDKPIGSIEEYLMDDSDTNKKYHQSFEAPEARILIVDDNMLNLKVLQNLLAPTSVQIDTALSGEECLEKTKEHFYHVILLDYMMPGMNGEETMMDLRTQENGLCRESAVIALTANVGNDSRNYYRNIGFDDYLEKPIDSAMLEKYILMYLPDDIVEYREGKQKHSADGSLEIKNVKQKKKKRIVVTTDCVAELPPDIIKKYSIGVMYLYIQTEHGRFADTREINSDNLPQYLTDDTATAYADSVSVEEYEAFFAEQLDLAEQVIHISMASGAGKSYGVSKLAAQGFDHVEIIDSGQISCGQSIVVMYAAQLAHNGYSAEQIKSIIGMVSSKIETQFIMPSAKIFYQNGYTNIVVAKICEWFHLHPVLRMHKSKLIPVGVCVGNMQNSRLRFIRRRLRFHRKINPKAVFITHVGLNVKQQQMIQSEITKKLDFEKIYLQKASFSSACNSGMGTFGFAFYRE